LGVVRGISEGELEDLGESKRRDLARGDRRRCRVCGVCGVTTGEDLALDWDRNVDLEGVAAIEE